MKKNGYEKPGKVGSGPIQIHEIYQILIIDQFLEEIIEEI